MANTTSLSCFSKALRKRTYLSHTAKIDWCFICVCDTHENSQVFHFCKHSTVASTTSSYMKQLVRYNAIKLFPTVHVPPSQIYLQSSTTTRNQKNIIVATNQKKASPTTQCLHPKRNQNLLICSLFTQMRCVQNIYCSFKRKTNFQNQSNANIKFNIKNCCSTPNSFAPQHMN